MARLVKTAMSVALEALGIGSLYNSAMGSTRRSMAALYWFLPKIAEVKMIVVGTVAVLSAAGLLALAMVLRGSAPNERPELLAAVADLIRAWRRPASKESTSPRRQPPDHAGAGRAGGQVDQVGELIELGPVTQFAVGLDGREPVQARPLGPAP